MPERLCGGIAVLCYPVHSITGGGEVMSLEQRVTTLENQNCVINERLGSIEISVKNTQKDIQKLFLHSARHEQQIEALNQKVDRRFDQLLAEQAEFKQETRERFDKIEDTLAIIVNHFQK